MKDHEYDAELLSRVLGSVAAQMRLPLSNIYGAWKNILPAEITPGSDGEKLAAILNHNCFCLLRLAENLNDMSLLTGGTLLDSTDEDIVFWLRELVEQAASAVRDRGLELTFRSTRPSHIVAFQKQFMEGLVWNLLSNAVKFTPAGGHIDVSLDFRAGQVLLTVSDTGCGISEEMMATVYDRYLHPERLDPQPHGLGLGLPLCRRIAECHGGRFMLSSREGEGTTVTVAIPDDSSGVSQIREPSVHSGFPRMLVGLSDALDFRSYLPRDLDN